MVIRKRADHTRAAHPCTVRISWYERGLQRGQGGSGREDFAGVVAGGRSMVKPSTRSDLQEKLRTATEKAGAGAKALDSDALNATSEALREGSRATARMVKTASESAGEQARQAADTVSEVSGQFWDPGARPGPQHEGSAPARLKGGDAQPPPHIASPGLLAADWKWQRRFFLLCRL